MWDFSYLKTWFNQVGLTKRNIFFLFIVHVVKFTNHGWSKKTYYAS